jgi:hypothetical protein
MVVVQQMYNRHGITMDGTKYGNKAYDGKSSGCVQ